MPGKLRSDTDLESDTAVAEVEMPRKQNEKKGTKEKPKFSKTEEEAEEKEEMISPKAKKVKKKAEPSEVDVHSPKSKKSKKKEEPSEDGIISPKTKVQKKSEAACEKTIVSLKTKTVIKNEEPSEEELGAPKPKKMKEEKEINGEIWEKSPNLKNGFPDSGSDSNSKEAASEENSELDREWLWSKKKELSLIFPYLKKPLNFSKPVEWPSYFL